MTIVNHSSKNGEVKQVTFEKTDKLSAGRYYVYITENKGTNSYITYDNSGYVCSTMEGPVWK